MTEDGIDLTHHARFESLRSGPASNSRTGTERRQIWATHIDLTRECERRVRGIDKDNRLTNNDLRVQEIQVRRTADRLRREREKLDEATAKRHALLEEMHRSHSDGLGEMPTAWTIQIDNTQLGHHKPFTLTKPNFSGQQGRPNLPECEDSAQECDRRVRLSVLELPGFSESARGARKEQKTSKPSPRLAQTARY